MLSSWRRDPRRDTCIWLGAETTFHLSDIEKDSFLQVYVYNRHFSTVEIANRFEMKYCLNQRSQRIHFLAQPLAESYW